ncbi:MULTISPECIES: hypothetical protein [Bacillales]|uniref:hypothetical protein n=1 Tax=Bacillales TaxID=1385 RepID=UPI001CFC963E|nr:hypothetical protein [Pseudalkalibacillus hwajinpoensis]WLR59810.1 hypothetical protein LC071_22335 [Pseudalkalibacillus hwajinpoensis]
MNLNSEIRHIFFDILSDRPIAKNFIENLENNSELILFGGCIRNYLDNEFSRINIPRDFDIVLNNNMLNLEFFMSDLDENLFIKRNKYGGYKVVIEDLKFDIWEIDKTWAFKEKKVEKKSYIDLVNTVFLNVDSLFYNLNTLELHDEEFKKALSTNKLDIVLQDNPYPELNLARAFRFVKKYNLQFSEDLKNFFFNWIATFEDQSKAINILKEIEIKRYKNTTIDNSIVLKATSKRDTTKSLVTI